MAKRFYEVGELIFMKEEKKVGKVKSINKEQLEVVISYPVYDENGVRSFETKAMKFMDIDKLRVLDTILFAKVKPDAIIPTKEFENGCYDVYPYFEEFEIEIAPGETKLIGTGIASSFDPKYRMNAKRERGSTGKLSMAVLAGQIDSNYRGEWFIAMNNAGNIPIVITKQKLQNDKPIVLNGKQYYPYTKAFCQVALEFVPEVREKVIPYEDLLKIPSKRGVGKLGSTNK